MPHTCQVGDRVRSVRGLSQEPIEGHSNAKPLIHRRRDFKLPASITPEYLLQGAAYALEQCGLLLRDAIVLYRNGSYSSAVALAALAREGLGLYVVRTFWTVGLAI